MPNLRTKFRSDESATSATGTFRAGKGTLDLYLEGENHLYNGIHITLVNFSGTVPEPGDLEDLPLADRFTPALIFFRC